MRGPVRETQTSPVMDKHEPAREPVEEPIEEPVEKQPVEETVMDPGIPAAIDFDSLRAISGDAVAWIFAPGTTINYVIAQSDDNSYYLRRLLDGTGAVCGTIFADYRCSSDFTDWNTIIYGHKMDNGTMFASLANYLNQAYYEEHPIIVYLCPRAAVHAGTDRGIHHRRL